MDKYIVLKILRKIYSKLLKTKPLTKPLCEQDPQKASDIIYEKLIGEEPCMIARFGSTELTTVVNYLGVSAEEKSIWKYIKGDMPQWWWNKNILNQMQNWSGFFPPTPSKVKQFCEMMLEDMKEVDVLGSWLEIESYFENKTKDVAKVHLRLLEPFWAKKSWTKALEGKKILVVHPFAESILLQYKNREKLFENPNILPAFASLHIIKAVQSLGGDNTQFKDWFEALEHMKNQIDAVDYDICLIGAGAYGFPLATHVKRQGKKAVHLGGALQLLFGIKGKRWEDPNYGVEAWNIPIGFYSSLMNRFWIRPLETEQPKNAQKVEGACYW